MSKLQAVYFEGPYWDNKLALKWLREHKLKPIKPVDRRGSLLRYRLRDPKLFDHFITKKIKDKSISLVIGFQPDDDPWA